MSEFWNTSVEREAGKLTPEAIEQCFRKLRDLADAPPPKCSHVVSRAYRDDMRYREARGIPIYCPWCGERVRV